MNIVTSIFDATFDFLFELLLDMFNIGTMFFLLIWDALSAAIVSVVTAVAMWLRELICDAVVAAIEAAVDFIIFIDFDLQDYHEFLELPGTVVFYMQIYLPIGETLMIFAAYYGATTAIWTGRHIIKLTPFIG